MNPTVSSPPRRRRAPAERPQEILDAALAEFAEKGFAAARLDDVARRAGCSKAAIYLYYRDKSALFEAVVRKLASSRIDVVREALLAAEGPIAPRLATLIGFAGERIGDGTTADLVKIIIGESRAFPELARLWHDVVVARILPVIAELVRIGIETGEFRRLDPDHVARSVVAPIIFGAVWRSVFERVGAKPLDIPAYFAAHLELVLAGLAPRPPEQAP